MGVWRNLLGERIDSTDLSIIRTLIERGPCTMYRVARELDAYFSHIYRKARKLECLGLITPIFNGRISVYSTTALGCLVCLDYECTGRDLVYKRLVEAWGVKLDPHDAQDVVTDLEEIYRPTDPVNDAGLVAACLLIRKWPNIRQGTKRFIKAAIGELADKLARLD